jgi:hypothetical protein
MLLKYIRDSALQGMRFQRLTHLLPMLTRRQIQKLLDELKLENLVRKEGKTQAALWYPVPIAPQ